MFAPSTMPQLHRGSHATWFPPNADQSPARGDYVLLPSLWLPFTTDSHVADIEALGDHLDHAAPFASVAFEHESAPPPASQQYSLENILCVAVALHIQR